MNAEQKALKKLEASKKAMAQNASANATKKRKKILCFHGYATSKEFMTYQTRHWRKSFKDEMELIPVDGKFPLPKEFHPPPSFVTKFHSERNLEMRSNLPVGNIRNFDLTKNLPIEALDIMFSEVIKVLNEHKDIEGILGFSQGGFLAASFFYFLEIGALKDLLNVDKIPHFLILVCGWSGFGTHLTRAKSLHLIGSMDTVYNAADVALIRYKRPRIFYFYEGHKFPLLNKKVKDVIREFLSGTNEERYREEIGYDGFKRAML